MVQEPWFLEAIREAPDFLQVVLLAVPSIGHQR